MNEFDKQSHLSILLLTFCFIHFSLAFVPASSSTPRRKPLLPPPQRTAQIRNACPGATVPACPPFIPCVEAPPCAGQQATPPLKVLPDPWSQDASLCGVRLTGLSASQMSQCFLTPPPPQCWSCPRGGSHHTTYMRTAHGSTVMAPGRKEPWDW